MYLIVYLLNGQILDPVYDFCLLIYLSIYLMYLSVYYPYLYPLLSFYRVNCVLPSPSACVSACVPLPLCPQAAYALPRWLKPETSSNRVWLRAGGLHIIPPPSRAAPQLPASPSTTQALHILGSGQVNTHNPR